MIEEVIRQQLLTESTLRRQYHDGQFMALNHQMHQLDEESRESLFRAQLSYTLFGYFLDDAGRLLTKLNLMPEPHRSDNDLQFVFGACPDEKIGRRSCLIDYSKVETMLSIYNPRTRTCVRIAPIYSLDVFTITFFAGCEYSHWRSRKTGHEYIEHMTKAIEIDTASTQDFDSTIVAYSIQHFLAYGREPEMADNYFNTH